MIDLADVGRFTLTPAGRHLLALFFFSPAARTEIPDWIHRRFQCAGPASVVHMAPGSATYLELGTCKETGQRYGDVWI